MSVLSQESRNYKFSLIGSAAEGVERMDKNGIAVNARITAFHRATPPAISIVRKVDRNCPPPAVSQIKMND